MKTFETIKKILKRLFDTDPGTVQINSSFEKDLGLNDIDLTELFMEIENRFSITISNEELTTISDLLSLIGEKTHDRIPGQIINTDTGQFEKRLKEQCNRLGIKFIKTGILSIKLKNNEYTLSHPLSSVLESLKSCKNTYYVDTLCNNDPATLRKIRFYKPVESLDRSNSEITSNPYISIAGDDKYLEDFLIRLDDPDPVNPIVYKYDWETNPYPIKKGKLLDFLSELLTEDDVAKMK